MNRRRFLQVSMGAGFAAAILGRAQVGRAAPGVIPSSAGWSSHKLDERRHFGLGSVGDFALIAGGELGDPDSPTPSDRVDVYNAATGAWTESKLAAPRRNPVVVGAGSRAFVIGGRKSPVPPIGPSDVMDIFDSASGTWSSIQMAEPCERAVVGVAGSTLVVASSESGAVRPIEVMDAGSTSFRRLEVPAELGHDGWRMAGGTSSVAILQLLRDFAEKAHRYDVSTGSLVTTKLTKYRYAPSVRIVDERIFVMTGPSSKETTMDVIDPAGQLSEIPLPRPGIGLDLSQGSYFLFSRFREPMDPAYPREYDLFDASRDRWLSFKLPRTRLGAGTQFFGNSLYFFGGISADPPYESTAVDVFDIPSGQWTSSELPRVRNTPGVATLGNRLILAGGSKTVGMGQPATHFDTVDILDTSTGAWSAGQLSLARQAPKSVVAGNKVLFVGGELHCTGCDGTILPAIADIFDAG